MFCSNCGRAIPEGVGFCPQCGKPTGAGPAEPAPRPAAGAASPPYGGPPAYAVASAAPAVPVPQLFYAGFWLRFVAYLIDSVILGVGCGVLVIILALVTGFAAMVKNFPENSPTEDFFTGAILLCVFGFIAVVLAGCWIYYAWMESSPTQGTLGKMALGLIVTDMQYQPVSFARASGRFWAKMITGLIPFAIGYIMAGFTAKKQALHDMIASCLVLRKT
jgi:uncharacterized RDD family membrane protein YckC